MLYYKYLFRGTFFILQIAPGFFRVLFNAIKKKPCPKKLKAGNWRGRVLESEVYQAFYFSSKSLILVKISLNQAF